MNAMADEVEASTPDYSPEEDGDDSTRLISEPEDDYYWEDQADQEDRYLDSYWEDQSEYGMEGCCGDF
jgi:hypothetical protein